jgi:O-antigen ligase
MEKSKFSNLAHILWYLLVLLLPITSFPLVGKLFGSNMVAAPSILILFFLLAVLFFQVKVHDFLNNPFRQILILFLLVAIISLLLSFWYPIPFFKNFSLLMNSLEGLGTLIIGVGFYFVTSIIIRNEAVMKKTIQFVIIGFIPMAFWSGFQFAFNLTTSGYPQWMISIQRFFSISGTLYSDRITGFAFEPSWLAHQLNMFYLPIWLGSSIKRKSVFSRSFKGFIFEDMMLGISVLMLVFTKSRVGWITFFVVATYLFIILNHAIIRKTRSKLNLNRGEILSKSLPYMFILFYLGTLFSGILFLRTFDPRMEALLRLDTYLNQSVYSIANQFVFVERILYWQTGWRVFNQFPFFGVGLGNVGFFFKDHLPSFAWALDEPRHLLFQAGYLGNVKNLWIRLLAETGIVGFLVFISWLLMVFFKSKSNQNSNNIIRQKWGLIGTIAILTILFEGFSIDSFALPYYWILLGLVTSDFFNSEKPS